MSNIQGNFFSLKAFNVVGLNSSFLTPRKIPCLISSGSFQGCLFVGWEVNSTKSTGIYITPALSDSQQSQCRSDGTFLVLKKINK